MKDAMELLDKLLLQETLDMKLLLHQSRSKGGFLSNSLRRKIYPKLLGINKYTTQVGLVDGASHRDKEQCTCDVLRSFQNICVHKNVCMSANKIANRRSLLDKIIMTFLVQHPSLYYYQGLNDVFAHVVLIMEDEALSYLVCEAVALKYLTDFMQPDFKNVGSLMSLIFVLLQHVDPELYWFLKQCEVQPFFATPWLVTWLSHDIKELSRVARVFDVMLCSVPMYSLYLSAAIIVYFRSGVLKCANDIASVHSFLGTLVKKKSFPFEEVAQLADKLLESFPASKLSALGHRLMSTYLSPARVRMLELNKPIPRYSLSDWKLLLLERSRTGSFLFSGQRQDLSNMLALQMLLVGDCAPKPKSYLGMSRVWRYSKVLVQASVVVSVLAAAAFSTGVYRTA